MLVLPANKFNSLLSVLVCLDCYNNVPLSEWLEQQKTLSQFWKLAAWGQGEKSLPSLQMATVFSHVFSSVCAVGRENFLSSCYKTTSPMGLGSHPILI